MPSYSYVKESRVQMNKSNQSLDNSLVKDILDYLDCPTKAPTLRYLNRLILAYIRKVPWESVSRIIKRHTTLETKNCPRLPKEFWIEAIQHSFGGTCFESSLAFYSSLTTLGYEGYLTVTAMFDYTLHPVSENKYELGRSHRSTKNLFTLVDVPVRLPAYIATVEDDYKETRGRFLNSVVMVKVIDGRAQRFFSDQKPYKLECLDRASRIEKSIEPEILPLFLAELFQIPEESISTAFSLIQDPTATVVVPALLQERIGQHA
jgi:hypothetical protein